MKHLLILGLLILSSLVASGCGKASNDARMAEEATGIVKNWAPRFDELARRGDGLVQRGIALGDSGRDADAPSTLLGKTLIRINELRGKIGQAPAQINVALNNAQKLGTSDELIKLMNNIDTELTGAHVELNAGLDSVESWLAFAEARPRPAPEPETAPAAPQPGPPDPAAPAGGASPPQQ
jgi:hypothetical protein